MLMMDLALNTSQNNKKSNIENQIMFYVPLCHIKIDNWKEKKQLLLELYSKIEKNVTYLEYNGQSTVKNDFGYQNSNNIEQMYTSTVVKILEDEIIQFKDAYNFNEIGILGAWFERGNMGDYHPVHNHGALGYSSVCFINYDSKVHTPTKFQSPFLNFVDGEIIHHIPPNIKEGSLIFFPSAIAHSTIPGQTDKDRLVLSFNLDVK